MGDERLGPPRASASAPPSSPTPAEENRRLLIEWFKAEAQTLDCQENDIERWHWQKVLAAVGR